MLSYFSTLVPLYSRFHRSHRCFQRNSIGAGFKSAARIVRWEGDLSQLGIYGVYTGCTVLPLRRKEREEHSDGGSKLLDFFSR